MAEIKSPDNLTELVEWIDAQISRFSDPAFGSGFEALRQEVYSRTLNDALCYIEMFCPELIDVIPEPHFSKCVSDEVQEKYRKTTIDRLQKLKGAIAPQKNKGGARKKNEEVWEFIKECDKEKPKPSAPDIAKRLNKKYSGHRTFTGASVRGIRFDYNGGRKRSQQNHKKRRRKTRRKTQ